MLSSRTAVVTGGSRGIGRAIALRLAADGANLAVIYAGATEAADTVCREASELAVLAQSYQCDVADFEQCKDVCARIAADFGRVDILVNNAGIVRDNLVLRMSEADFDAVMNTNLKGAFNMIKHLARPLMHSPAGRIINIASVSGLMGNPGQANYSAAKAGIIGLTKTMARELASRGVTSNAIAPGFIQTAMTADLPKSVQAYIDTSIPLKRIGSVDDVAALAAFLASDAASYITGEVIKVDGGMYI